MENDKARFLKLYYISLETSNKNARLFNLTQHIKLFGFLTMSKSSTLQFNVTLTVIARVTLDS